jgi:hypothetical protein
MSARLTISFTSELIYWRGPSPFYFFRVPEKEAAAIAKIASEVTYGWGVIPADITIKDEVFYTALFPKDGSYLVPLKKAIREKLKIELGDRVKIKIAIAPPLLFSRGVPMFCSVSFTQNSFAC